MLYALLVYVSCVLRTAPHSTLLLTHSSTVGLARNTDEPNSEAATPVGWLPATLHLAETEISLSSPSSCYCNLILRKHQGQINNLGPQTVDSSKVL